MSIMRCVVFLALFPVSLQCSGPAQAEQDSYRIVRDIPFGQVGGTALKLDAYLVEGGRRRPAVVYVHGGGFTSGDKSHLDKGFKEIRDLVLAEGFHLFSVNYRLAPQHPFPAATDDVGTSIAWIRKNAAAYRVDPERLALMGDSAGGMLVSYCGARFRDERRVAAVVSFFGEHDFALRVTENPCAVDGHTIPRPPGGCISGGMAAFLGFRELKTDKDRKQLAEATVVNHVHPGMPAYLLFHGTRDYGVPIEQSHSLQQAMERIGEDCTLVAVVGGGHGIGGWVHPHQVSYKQRLMEWLRKSLN